MLASVGCGWVSEPAGEERRTLCDLVDGSVADGVAARSADRPTWAATTPRSIAISARIARPQRLSALTADWNLAGTRVCEARLEPGPHDLAPLSLQQGQADFDETADQGSFGNRIDWEP
jgi:hypothetical protein